MADTTPQRSRRLKADRNGRFAALEKLKQLKGSKHKYEVEEFENVYEEVDEKEYSRKVLERQVDDWIVDDDGSGYVEDGREIFDDDLDDESITSASRQKNSYSGKHVKKSNSKNDAKKNGDGSASIRNMLMNMPSRKRKREANVKLDDDDILGDIMQELHGNNSISKKQSLGTELSPQSYLKSLAETAAPKRLKAPEEKQQSPLSYLKSLPETDTTSRFKRPVEKKESPLKPKISVSTTKAVHNKPDNIKQHLTEKIQDEEFDDGDDDTTIVDASQMESQQEPIESQIIEDFDSNDGFPESSAFAMIDDEVNNIKENGTEKASEDKMASNIAASEPTIPKLPIEKLDPTDRNMRNKEFDNRDDNLLAAWASMTDNIKQESEAAAVSISGSELPLVRNGNNKEVLRFFWLDAYEEPFKQPGVVYLFGKVYVESAKTYVSCCVSVKNIERKIYLLPREERWDLEGNVSTGQEVKFPDVYEEFNKKIAEKNKILQFKCRKVERSYCFNAPGVPLVSEYLEVKYPAQYPSLPSDLKGETFSHVFGTRTSSLELLLLDRKIRGPCWLDIHEAEPVTNPISWCKIEAVCSKLGHLEVSTVDPKPPPPPPLVILALNVRTVANVRTSQSEVVMVSCLVHSSFPLDRGAPQPPFQQHFCVVTRPSDGAFPMDVKESLSRYRATKVERVDSERALLCYLVAKVSKIDPDLIVGHDLHGYALELLVHRLQVHKVPHWSKLGRLRRANLLSIKGKQVGLERQVTSGRLICDVKISAKELIRARSYDLGTLCKQVLNVEGDRRWDLTANEVRDEYNSSESLVRLISLTMQDTAFILRLMCDLNVLPLALQITNIAGNVMSRTLLGGRSERNEYLLLHAFSEKDYIVPDKEYGKKKVAHEDFDGENDEDGDGTVRKSRKKAQYAGGLVLEPKKGFYDKLVLLMDFNSLYPSIIQEYNICFTTVKHSNLNQEDMIADVPDSNQNAGILPTEIRKLVESRRAVKKLMNANDLSPDLKMQYNIRQMALKLTANSMYGCLGFSHSRFYARPIAALVTAKGREILMNTKDIVEKMNYEVIYGDTDSLMINTKCLDYEEVFKIGSKIKQEINKLYKLIELEVDGVFKYLLLLKKKKYAAVTLTRLPNGELLAQQEHKGLDIVRRDWSQLSAGVGKNILNEILSDQSADERVENIHAILMKVRDDLHAGTVPIDLLAITKQLTKAVNEYADKKSLPHVQVAMRLNSKSGAKHLKAGDTVSYIICEDGSNLPATQRAYHVDELKENDKLKVDVNYYLSQQIHPVVSRLCEPIEGTDAARIAECLDDVKPIEQPVSLEDAPCEKPPPRELPPYNGYGSYEDSAGNCRTVMPTPPRCDFVKFLHKDRHGLDSHILRFKGEMISKIPENRGRIFIISYYLSDDTMSVFEAQQTGFKGGMFYACDKMYKPGQNFYTNKEPDAYTTQDLYVGNVLNIHEFLFRLTATDEYCLRYMELHPNEFPWSNIHLVMGKVREALKPVYKDFVCKHLVSKEDKNDGAPPGLITFNELRSAIKEVMGDNIKEHEIITLARHYGVRCKREKITKDQLRSIVHTELRRFLFCALQRMSETLHYLDVGKTGFLPKDRVYYTCRASNVPLDKDILLAVLDRMEHNERGEISYLELVDFLNTKKEKAAPCLPDDYRRDLSFVYDKLETPFSVIDFDAFLKDLDLEKTIVNQSS